MNTNIFNSAKFLDPVRIVGQIDVKDGEKVADFGCGAGFFSIELAKKVGVNGEVYAIDIMPSALESVTSRAKNLGLNNIFPERANLEGKKGSGLGASFVDLVVIKDMLFQNRNKEIILKEAYKVLKPEGKVLVVEWNNKDFSIGPDKNLRVSEESLKKMAQNANFQVEKELEAGDFHYSVLLNKKS